MATPMMQITYDKAKVAKLERLLRDHPQVLRTIVPRGINRTAIGARAQAAKMLQDDINTSAATIKKGIRQSKASRNHWVGTLSVSPFRIPLIKFKGTRQGKKGVSYAIRRGGRQMAEGAFVRTMSSGHKGVYARAYADGPGGTRAGGVLINGRRRVAQLPIVELSGPSLAQAVKNAPDVVAKVMKESQARLERELVHNAEREIARRMPR